MIGESHECIGRFQRMIPGMPEQLAGKCSPKLPHLVVALFKL